MLWIKRLLRRRYNYNGIILCALVFFAIGATAFCMVANSKESAKEKARAEQLLKGEGKELNSAAAAVKKVHLFIPGYLLERRNLKMMIRLCTLHLMTALRKIRRKYLIFLKSTMQKPHFL